MKRKSMVGFWLMVVLIGISLLPVLSLQAQELAQTTITLTPVADASIESGSPDTNFGGAETLGVYYGGENEIGRALIRFNLAVAVPPEAIIDSARLDLFLEGSEDADPVNLVAARLTEDWAESQVTWNNRPATGEPVVAALVDTSWGYKSLDVTEIVRAWHNVPHYGLELSGPEGETVYNRIFGSRERDEIPPQLVVTYHLPPPQPQQVYLSAVEPREGLPGQEIELALLGGGFDDAAEVQVSIGEIEVWEAWVESDEMVMAHVFIPEDAPSGPRPVEVIAVFGPGEEFPARLDEGFFVREPEPALLPFVDSVEPQQVQRGSEGELNVFGGNFLPDAWVEIGGEGVIVHEVEFVNAEHLRAFGEVLDDAPLGWRGVVVINPDGQAGERENVLEVVGEGPTPTDQPALYEVEPREVEQGSEVELTVFGANLTPDTEVLIHGGGVEVREVRFVDASRLIVKVGVTADAEPGPRLVELSTAEGRAELLDGLIVIRRGALLGPTPTSTSPPVPPSTPTMTPPGPGEGGGPDLIPDWVWAGATVLLSGLSFAVGRALGLKSKLTWTNKARVQWRVEAEKKLPDPQRACQWACKANVSADLLDRWRVTAIELTPLKSKGKTPPKKCVEDKALLAPLNDLANIGKILHREDEVRRRLAPIVDALLAQIIAWEQEGQTPASIRVDAKLEAPINAQFGLYHCKQTKGGLGWGKPLVTWKGKLNQPGGEFLGVLRGPTAGEPDFAARARQELETCLLDLVSVARFRL